MTKLYSELATAYHEMYQTIFDYKKEFQFYNRLLKKYKCRKILEIGCGSGNLAPFFLEAKYDYVGLDLFNEMIKIAKEVEPKAKFIQGNMRNLKVKDKFDAILITGRSFTYMTTNDDVMNTLKSIHRCLKKNGFLIFDNFDAEVIFGNFKGNFVQTAKYNEKEYKRVSKNNWNMETGWTWNWNATYHIKEHGKTKIIEDKSVLRGFTEDELKLFLKINRFDTLEIIKEGSSITAVAKKL
jgi:ubiquinone/menaquinone biosynthesis C-methylase UbiE